jgi:hypothetical protein
VKPYNEHLPDYEVELVIVIGKPAKNVSENDALDYVLGYTGANDVSGCDWSLLLTTKLLQRYPLGNGNRLFHRWASPKASITRIRWALSWSIETPSVMFRT